ncbi:PAS domain-containing protein [Streptomyces sp. NPDC087659]|uniref:PAS domain-containing protein n=1 Tax=unclassified Streptomyces TaxID=2593676 RepID=UPI0036CBCA2E
MDGGVPPAPRRRSAAVGATGLAVVVADGHGRVSHWSAGARALFGHDTETAVGRPAVELLPVSGALAAAPPSSSPGRDGPGPAPDSPPGTLAFYPAAGRARLGVGGGRPPEERIDVLWWAYPLVGPGPERLLVLAADAGRFGSGHASGTGAAGGGERIAPGFALHTELPDSGDLVRRLAGTLPGLGVRDPGGIVDQVRELGCPVVEFRRHDRVPDAPGRGVPGCRSSAPGGDG